VAVGRGAILFDLKAGYNGNRGLSGRRSSVRIENIDQSQWNASEIVVILSLFVNHEFARREQESGALCRVGIIQVELANRKVERLGRRKRVIFIER
jgi:hypothetical protein